MAYEFKSLADVEILTEVPEGASVFAEVNGAIKRVPGEGLGGAGIKTAIIKQGDYDEALAFFASPPDSAPTAAAEMEPYSCINMTFEEAYQIMANGEPLACFLMAVNDLGPINLYGTSVFTGVTINGTPCIPLMFYVNTDINIVLFWTADGLSTEQPGSGGYEE